MFIHNSKEYSEEIRSLVKSMLLFEFLAVATRMYPLFHVRINFTVVKSSSFFCLLHDRYHTPKCSGKFVHFVLLTGIDALTLRNDRPVGDRLILPGGKGPPDLQRGPQYQVEMGWGGPKFRGGQNFMTPERNGTVVIKWRGMASVHSKVLVNHC